MRIYLAGYYNGKASAYSIQKDQYDWFLESYHYINTSRHVAMIRADKRTIFLDSGAFSAFTKGAEIKLEDYAAFIHKTRDIVHLASNLDDLHKREDLTWKNQKALESMGCKVLPVFHTRENPTWLKKYIDAGYDYIALGGMVAESKQWLIPWLDAIWGEYLTDAKGRARIKVHGFGMTNFDIARRYPWFSVDSTGWVLAGRYGLIFVPTKSNPYLKVAISEHSPKRRDWDSHYDSMSPALKREVEQAIESRGFTVTELRTIYWKRDLYNIKVFKEMSDDKTDTRFKRTEMGLF